MCQLVRGLRSCSNEVNLLALLNNWYCVTTPVGTLPEDIDYAKKCYDGVIKSDATFRKLFGTESWSRAAIEGGGSSFTVEIFLFTSALAEIASSESFLPGEGTAASPMLGCCARNFGQLLMSARRKHPFVHASPSTD